MTAAVGTRYVHAARSVTRGSFIALGASIPISSGLDNTLFAVIILSWLIAGEWRERLPGVRSNPVVVIGCAWFAVHLLAAFYSIGAMADVATALRKASTFLLLPIAVVTLQDANDRERAWFAFLAAIALTVVLSTMRWTGAIPDEFPGLRPAGYSPSVVFKFQLTQNLLVAFGAFAFAVHAHRATSTRLRWLLAACAAACAINVDFIGDGRTGQLVLFVLIVYFGAWRAGLRGAIAGLAAASVFSAVAYVTPGSSLQRRSAVAMDEAEQWQTSGRSRGSSAGERLEFYENTLPIIRRHPIVGVGTGGFAAAYEKQVRGSEIPPTRNPHSEYLLKAVEFGIPGLCLLLALFWTCWHTACRLPDTHHTALARGVVIAIGAASLVSSTLSDHTESFLFVWAIGLAFAGLRSKLA